MLLPTRGVASVGKCTVRRLNRYPVLENSRGAGVSSELRNYFTLSGSAQSFAICQKSSSGFRAQFSSSDETIDRLSNLSPYQLMQKIRGVEAVPSFSQRRVGNASEQKWFNQFLDKEITEAQLIDKVNKLEEKNTLAKPQAPLFTDEIAISATEKWIKECIVGMGLCPYAATFEKRRTLHVVQTLGIFVPTEYIALHAYHLLAEREVAVKLIIFPNRGNYIAFQEMFDFVTQTEAVRKLIEDGLIKIDMFHPKAENPLYLEGKIPIHQ